MKHVAAVVLCSLFFPILVEPAMSAEIRVLSTHAALEVLHDVTQEFERTTGHKLSFSYDPALAIKRQIENGQPFDVALITRRALDDLAKQGKISPDTIKDLARSGLGVSVRKGLPKPDIGSVENFKRALLDAKSIVRSTEGTSGLYFEQLTERLGIAQDIKAKVKLGPSGRVTELVARGEADMAVQQISELLPVAGADFVGPFPPEVQLYTIFAAGVNAASPNREAAIALIKLLAAPGAAGAIKASGLDPIAATN